MSTHYTSAGDVPTPVLCQRLKELVAAVVTNAKHEFCMRIPAEFDHDADLVIQEAERRLRTDSARLDWLLRHISGKEARDLGMDYAGGLRREHVDVAMERQALITAQ